MNALALVAVLVVVFVVATDLAWHNPPAVHIPAPAVRPVYVVSVGRPSWLEEPDDTVWWSMPYLPPNTAGNTFDALTFEPPPLADGAHLFTRYPQLLEAL